MTLNIVRFNTNEHQNFFNVFIFFLSLASFKALSFYTYQNYLWLTNSLSISCLLSKNTFFLNCSSSYRFFLSSTFSTLKSTSGMSSGFWLRNSWYLWVSWLDLVDWAFYKISLRRLRLIRAAFRMYSSHSYSSFRISFILWTYWYF